MNPSCCSNSNSSTSTSCGCQADEEGSDDNDGATTWRQDKEDQIRQCLAANVIDLWQLRELALSKGGLVNGEIRKRAWPILVGLDDGSIEEEEEVVESVRAPQDAEEEALCSSQKEKELELIRCDAGRSVLFRYRQENNTNHHFKQKTTAPSGNDDEVVHNNNNVTPHPSGESTSQHDMSYSDQQEQVTKVLIATTIMSSKSNNTRYHYYQGLHDIAGVLLWNIVGQQQQQTKDSNTSSEQQPAILASAILKRLASVHLRDAMRQDLSLLTCFLKVGILPLLQFVDVELHDYFVRVPWNDNDDENVLDDVLIPVTLPWIITWFCHDIHNERVASRLVDAFVSSHALFPLYFAMALMAHPRNRFEILNADMDPVSIHLAIRSLTSRICTDWTIPNEESVAVQDLIDDAITFMRRKPPRSIMNLVKQYNDNNNRVSVDADDDRDESRIRSMEKASSVSLLKASPSWAMAATMNMRRQHNKENGNNATNYWKYGLKRDKESVAVRAKCASGVPFLLSTKENETIISKRLEQPSSSSSSLLTVNTTRWELCHKILFGSFSTEDPTAACPFFPTP